MSLPSLLIAFLADFLGSTNAFLSGFVSLPTNATGPLDPSITLTDSGVQLVHEIARIAVAWSGTLALTLNQLVH